MPEPTTATRLIAQPRQRRRGTAIGGAPGYKDCRAAPRSERGREGGGGEALRDCGRERAGCTTGENRGGSPSPARVRTDPLQRVPRPQAIVKRRWPACTRRYRRLIWPEATVHAIGRQMNTEQSHCDRWYRRANGADEDLASARICHRRAWQRAGVARAGPCAASPRADLESRPLRAHAMLYPELFKQLEAVRWNMDTRHSVGPVRRQPAQRRAGADHQDERHHRVGGAAGHRDVPARQPRRQRLLAPS